MVTLLKAGGAMAFLNRQYNVKRGGMITRAVDRGVKTAEVIVQRSVKWERYDG
jgi:hypothetical protein